MVLPTRLKIIDPQEHSHEERCAIIDAHTLTTIPTTFVFLEPAEFPQDEL